MCSMVGIIKFTGDISPDLRILFNFQLMGSLLWLVRALIFQDSSDD